MRTPSARYWSIWNDGSTTPAVSPSPIRYEAQPRSSSTNCRKSTARSLQPEVLGNHHALHLVGAFADLEDLLVAVEARDRVLVHEPVAAVDLQRPVRSAVRELAGVELRHRRGSRERPALVLLPGGAPHEHPRRLDLGRHVDELVLHGGELRDRLPELLALPGIRVRKVVTTLRKADAHRGDGDAAAVEDLQELLEAVAARAEQVAFRDARSLERQLARIRRAPAELLHRLRDDIPVGAVLDDDVRDLAVTGDSGDRHAPRDVGPRVGDEHLR